MPSKKYENMTNEELIKLVKHLKDQKKYGLVWEDKPEDVVTQCKTDLPVLEEISDKGILVDSDKLTNILIEGDNYHALSVLNYTHAGKVDVIYIDPPYNKGTKDFRYNDKWIDIEDTYRHSKWVSFMYKRLKMAKPLLTPDGIIFISIDDNEFAQLKLICNEIFTEKNFLGTITWEKRTKAQNTESAREMLQSKTEYILVYKNTPDKMKFKLEVAGEKIYDNQDSRGLYRLKLIEEMSAIGMRGRKTMIFPINGISPRTGFQWKYGIDEIKKFHDRNAIEISNGRPYFKIRPEDENNNTYIPFWSHFFDKTTYGTAEKGKSELTEILGDSTHDFETVKPVELIRKLLFHINKGKKEVVLDFFAGSGTTGHAVMLLNKIDGGERQFILCTDNENEIAEEVCYPRIKNVINGVDSLPDITGMPNNVRYFKTAFVSKSKVSDDTRRDLVKRSTEMICIKENTFERIQDFDDYKIFKDSNHISGILLNLDSIDIFKSKIIETNLPASIYIFSLTNDRFEEDFQDLPIEHELCPIPESILEVYRRLFKD